MLLYAQPRTHAQRQAQVTTNATIEPSRFHRRQHRTHELDLYGMANVQPKTTGLPMMIHISNKNAQHASGINVSQQYGTRMNASELCMASALIWRKAEANRQTDNAADACITLTFVGITHVPQVQVCTSIYTTEPARWRTC